MTLCIRNHIGQDRTPSVQETQQPVSAAGIVSPDEDGTPSVQETQRPVSALEHISLVEDVLAYPVKIGQHAFSIPNSTST